MGGLEYGTTKKIACDYLCFLPCLLNVAGPVALPRLYDTVWYMVDDPLALLTPAQPYRTCICSRVCVYFSRLAGGHRSSVPASPFLRSSVDDGYALTLPPMTPRTVATFPPSASRRPLKTPLHWGAGMPTPNWSRMAGSTSSPLGEMVSAEQVEAEQPTRLRRHRWPCFFGCEHQRRRFVSFPPPRSVRHAPSRRKFVRCSCRPRKGCTAR